MRFCLLCDGFSCASARFRAYDACIQSTKRLDARKGGTSVPTDTRIIVQGCDEATVVILSLTAAERGVINRLAAAVSLASSSACHPKIEVGG